MRGWGSRSRLVVGTVVVGALIATACESDGEKSSSGLHLATVVRSTEDAGTARVAGSATRRAASGKPEASTIVGALDFANRDSSVVTHGRFGRHPFVIRTRRVGGFLYIGPPDVRVVPPKQLNGLVFLTHGKQWVRYPYSEGGGAVPFGDGGDIGLALTSYGHTGGHVQHVASDHVRGVATQHYRFSIPPSPVPSQVQATSFVRRERQTFDIWVDGQHRLRRVQRSVVSDRQQSKSRMEYFDFGTPIRIAAPAVQQVAVDDANRLTGSWKLVQHGRKGGVSWSVYRAPTASGVCFAHESDPPDPTSGVGLDQRGRATEICSSPAYDGNPPLPNHEVTTASVALPNGSALLYGQVRPAVRSLTLYLANGEATRGVPHDLTFAMALGSDQVVRKIVLHGAKRSVTCMVSRTLSGYGCSGTLEPATAPGVPIPPPAELGPAATATPDATVDTSPAGSPPG